MIIVEKIQVKSPTGKQFLLRVEAENSDYGRCFYLSITNESGLVGIYELPPNVACALVGGMAINRCAIGGAQ
jgi:hypothetical protein